MRLSDHRRVADLVSAREYLIGLKEDGRIEISISGAYQDRTFVGSVESTIRLELRHRIHEIDQQLIELGVEIA